MSIERTLAATIVLGLVLIGCGDDEGDGVDAGHDAGTTMDAATPVDAAMADAAMADAPMVDAATGAFTSTLALTTAEEAPVCIYAGASAMGSGTVSIDAANTTITVSITFSGLSGDATAGHIHSGASGVAGPAVLPFTDLTSPIDETFTAADYPSPAPAGAPADFAAFIAAMRSGGTYVNIHTAMCAPGEIRDQIE